MFFRKTEISKGKKPQIKKKKKKERERQRERKREGKKTPWGNFTPYHTINH